MILVAYPLPEPTLTCPVGGEVFATGTPLQIQWNRNGAPAKAAARIEYSSRMSGDGVSFYDPVEAGANGWVTSKAGGSDWAITSSASHSPSRCWYAADDASTADQFLTRSSLAVTNGAVVEISTNGTAWTDLGTQATQNGYNGTISDLYSSPIGGRRAFNGSSGGFVETRIPLTGYEGKTVDLRFRESDDITDSSVGWWVDDIRIFIDATWTVVATTPTNTSSFAWTLPTIPGTNYGVRVRLTGSNCTDSAWAASEAFSLVATTSHGTPEPWLDQYGLVSGGNYEAADAADTDGDGLAAWQEYVAGTVPTNPVSVFRATFERSGGQLHVYWMPDLTGAVPARVYSLFGVSNLMDVFPIIPVTNNIPAGTRVPVQSLEPYRFFKVGVGTQP